MVENFIIDIKVNSATNPFVVFVDSKLGVFVCNGQTIKKDPFKFKEKLADIVIYWDNSMINPVDFIAESYSVQIAIDGSQHNFEGKGIYPSNYQQFKNLLMELLDE